MDQNEKDEVPSDRPRRRWWRWVQYVFLIWIVFTATFNAFRQPWTWNQGQIWFVLIALFAVLFLASWAGVWWRGGMSAVKERWKENQRATSKPLSKTVYRWSLVFWIAVALALVVLFNVIQRR